MRISIRNLSKTYPRGSRALKDVTLDIESGLFGLLGTYALAKDPAIVGMTDKSKDAGVFRLRSEVCKAGELTRGGHML